MLVLTRKAGETLTIGNVVITVKKITSTRVAIGIEAPKPVLILRGELERKA